MRRGWAHWRELCKVVPFPEKRHGGLLVAWSAEEAERLQAIHERAALNGVETKLLAAEEVRPCPPQVRSPTEAWLGVRA